METILRIATHPQFASFLLGAVVPFLYNLLTEGGVAIPPQRKVWLNLLLATTVSFIPVLARWGTQGMPDDPAIIFGAMTSAMLGSELAYRTWFKEKMPTPSGRPRRISIR